MIVRTRRELNASPDPRPSCLEGLRGGSGDRVLNFETQSGEALTDTAMFGRD